MKKKGRGGWGRRFTIILPFSKTLPESYSARRRAQAEAKAYSRARRPRELRDFMTFPTLNEWIENQCLGTVRRHDCVMSFIFALHSHGIRPHTESGGVNALLYDNVLLRMSPIMLPISCFMVQEV